MSTFTKSPKTSRRTRPAKPPATSKRAGNARPSVAATKIVGPIRPQARPHTKQATVIALLRRSRGASIEELQTATGWQAHSVRGAISGTLKKKLGLAISSERTEGRGRVYRIAKGA